MAPSSDVIAREILDVVPLVMRMIRAEMRSQRSANLAIPQFRTLLFVSRNPGVSLQSVAHHLGLTSPTVCRIVDGLVLDHFIKREPSQKDRRKITLTMTDQGQKILEEAHNATQARLAEVLSRLTPEEGETVFQAMKLLQPLFVPGASNMETVKEGKPI